MKSVIFDCSLGIAGDMTVGAFLDAGMPFEVLKRELAKLKLKGYSIERKKIKAGAFRSHKFSVKLSKHVKHFHTGLREIKKIIDDSKLDSKVKILAKKIFTCLGRAEARVHGIPLTRVHFHEVGAVDSIVDIVGTAICFHYFGIKKAYVRKISVGQGISGGSHGSMLVPVPGAYELLKGFKLTQS